MTLSVLQLAWSVCSWALTEYSGALERFFSDTS